MLQPESPKCVLNEFDTAELSDLEVDPHEVSNKINDQEYAVVAARLY